jgi:catechol 2,3-dioxygenase-like lactoylglutathione lyase family enzyme
MTQIKSLPLATRRAGEFGVHSLNHFCIAVPELARAEEFYQAFGLRTLGQRDQLSLYTEGNAHRWGMIVEGSRKHLHHLSFAVFEEDLKPFEDRLTSLGVARIDAPPGVESNAIWFRDHDGTPVEVRVAEKTSPDHKQFGEFSSSPEGARGAPKRSEVQLTSPRRLAHILLFTSDVDRAINFYTTVLGLRLSDRAGDNIAFLHGIYGSDHHMVAFVKSEGPGLHHCSWDLPSLQQVGLRAMHMADRGYAKGWGLGRHVLGSNFFHYVRDPWGSYAEYSSDMDYIPASMRWEAGDHLAEDAFYVWGPEPPDDFGRNYELGN